MSRVRRVALAALCAGALTVSTAGASVGTTPVIPGAKPIALTTPTSGVGTHPILRWKAANGVVTYVVVVQTPKGAPYWSGRATDPKLRLGGGPLDAPKQAGAAALTRKMQWFVFGLDGAGTVVAASERRSIAP